MEQDTKINPFAKVKRLHAPLHHIPIAFRQLYSQLLEPITPGYFEATRIPLLRGRVFTDADNDQPGTGAVVVSKSFAERFWPGEDPIGKAVAPNGQNKGPFYRVVGVVGDVFRSSPTEDPAVVVYYPTVQIPESSGWSPTTMSLVVRTTLDSPLSLLPQVQTAVRLVDPSIPLANAQEMQTLVDRSMSRISFTMTLIGLAAGKALLPAAVGLYGVISYLVARRTGEIGVRMALGAQARTVEHQILGGSIKLVAMGLVAGGGAALVLTQLMRRLLYGVQPTDPTAYIFASLLLVIVALLASYLPARRAARIDPAVALITE